MPGPPPWSCMTSILVLQQHLCLGYELSSTVIKLEHLCYALPQTFLAPFAVATINRSPRPKLLLLW
jgi:hypothetical protein